MKSLAVIALLSAAVAHAEPRQTLENITPLALSGDNLSSVRAAFNSGLGGPRLLVFLSAGCAACVPAATALQKFLDGQAGLLTVIIVWDDVLSKPPRRPSREFLWILTDRRVLQLWDPGHLMS